MTSRCWVRASASAARSAARPTNDVSGDGSDGRRRPRGVTAASIGRERGRQVGERAAVGHVELAQQRRDVALDRPDRDEQPARDLGVGQVVAHQRQHLGLAFGDAGVVQQLGTGHGTDRIRGRSVADPWSARMRRRRARDDSDRMTELEEDTMHPIIASALVRMHQAELRQQAEHERLYQAVRAARRARRSAAPGGSMASAPGDRCPCGHLRSAHPAPALA